MARPGAHPFTTSPPSTILSCCCGRLGTRPLLGLRAGPAVSVHSSAALLFLLLLDDLCTHSPAVLMIPRYLVSQLEEGSWEAFEQFRLLLPAKSTAQGSHQGSSATEKLPHPCSS